MTDETKEMIKAHLIMLKQVMKEDGLILAIAVDESDYDNSKICFINKDKYMNKKIKSGISVGLTEFNKDLI